MTPQLKQKLAEFTAQPILVTNYRLIDVEVYRVWRRAGLSVDCDVPQASDIKLTGEVKARDRVTLDGITRTVEEWARLLGLTSGALVHRLERWTVREALTKLGQKRRIR